MRRNDILDDLAWRGLLADTTDLDALRRRRLRAGPFYCGLRPHGAGPAHRQPAAAGDPAPLAARRPPAAGVVGGATGLIGDPGRQAAERVLNDAEVVAGWVERHRGADRPVPRPTTGRPAPVVNNLDWTAPLSALDFLRDVGKHFSVNRMLAREVVRARLEAGGISYTEFCYQLLQAYGLPRAVPALRLRAADRRQRPVGQPHRRGGPDPAGRRAQRSTPWPPADHQGRRHQVRQDRGRRDLARAPDLMSPYAFYQYLLNVRTPRWPGLLRVFSFQSREEIEALERGRRSARPPGQASVRWPTS